MEEKRVQLSEKDIANSYFSVSQIWERNKVLVILGLVGAILVGVGVFSVLLGQQKEPEIEIIPAQEETKGMIFVDLTGAVGKPGVYELPADSRINDLLIRAGGLSAEADREWVEGNLNLAQKLIDGSKLYIPKMGEIKGTAVGSSSEIGKININTASASELDSLWGIGEKRASDIVKNRPYQSLEELVSRKVIPQNVYQRIKDEISVY